MRVENLSIGIITQSSQEAQKGLEDRDESINEALTEHEDLDSSQIDVFQGIFIQIGKSDLVGAPLEDHLNMLEFSVPNKEPVFTENTSGSLGINSESHILGISRCIIVIIISESELLEAQTTIETIFLSLFNHISSKDG